MEVVFMHWAEVSRDQFVTRWPPAAEYVRREDSAKSLGEPEAYSRSARSVRTAWRNHDRRCSDIDYSTRLCAR
jgi:hypothetical protein